MTDFVIRNMLTGALSAPFGSALGFKWANGDYVHKRPEHGDAHKDGEIAVEKVYEIVELAPTGSGSIDTPGDPTYDEANDRVTRSHTLSLPPATAAMVQRECARRLALGFDYDFGDARGVHRIGTTERDMSGWQEVTMLAQARINAGDTAKITIATDTSAVQVSPSEWNAIMLAASAFRQPIWLASFVLQAMTPIPDDYAADERWE